MSLGDHQDDQCQWCAKPLAKRTSQQRLHPGACRTGMKYLQIEISQRLRVLGRELGFSTHEMRIRIRERGCDVCGQRSFTGRGPAKIAPYPSYRTLLGRYLVCKRCFEALQGPSIDCPPIVMRWILGKSGTRMTDADRANALNVPITRGPSALTPQP